MHYTLKSYSPLYTAITTGTSAADILSRGIVFMFEIQASVVLSQLSLGGN